MKTIQTDVLIVGGGPVGLAAAVELGMNGIRTVLLEQQPTTPQLPKMNHVNTRTMELCRRWGIASHVRAAGWPSEHPMDVSFVTSLAGHEVLRIPFPSHRSRTAPDYSPEPSQRCPQIWFDPILEECARAQRSCDVRFGHALRSFQDQGAGILADAEQLSDGTRYRIEAQYLIGADGAGSPIRSQLGIAREQWGEPIGQAAIALRTPNLWSHHDKGRSAFYYVMDPKGLLGLVTPTDGNELWRFNIGLGERPFENFDPHEAVRRLAGFDFEYEIVSVLPWQIRFTLANSYNRGRVLLAGDAVHTVSPTGGLGMNTGIADSLDIGWKLAAVLKGWGGSRLIESYHAERHPIGAGVIGESARNTRRLLQLPHEACLNEDSEEGVAARLQLREALIASEVRREWENDGTSLGLRLTNSPIVSYDAIAMPEANPNDYVPLARPGCRAPHAWLSEGKSTLDLFFDGMTLLAPESNSAGFDRLQLAARRSGTPLAIKTLESPSTRAPYGNKYVLVRPDGYIAWVGSQVPADAGAILDSARGAILESPAVAG